MSVDDAHSATRECYNDCFPNPGLVEIELKICRACQVLAGISVGVRRREAMFRYMRPWHRLTARNRYTLPEMWGDIGCNSSISNG